MSTFRELQVGSLETWGIPSLLVKKEMRILTVRRFFKGTYYRA